MEMAAVSDLELTPTGELRMHGQATPTPMPEEDRYLLLERDLLDQQIIDVHGHKVVRVNDVELVWHARTRCGGSRTGLRGRDGAWLRCALRRWRWGRGARCGGC